MKVIKIHEFGGPEVLKIEEVETPVPQSDEILVKMYASGVNQADYIVRQGGNEILKPFLKLPLGLGLDGAGIIEEIGSEVTGFNKGDKVYGLPNFLSALMQSLMSISIDTKQETTQSGWLLLIHPDFLWNTSLAKSIRKYDFWDYSVHESLFLSAKEEAILIHIFQNIKQEYHTNMTASANRSSFHRWRVC